MRAVIFIHVLYLLLINTFTVKAGKCESRVELRAVLLSCPVKDSGCDDDDALSQSMKSEEIQILQTDPNNCEKIKELKAREFPCAVKDCKRKLIITLKIKNSGKIPCDDEYIVVDHVFDPLTGGRGRLLSPVVIKLRQEQMVQLYGLQFQRAVNSDPFEEKKPLDTGCAVDPKNPPCGIAMYNGKPIPFSEGFCCSLDPHVNAKRQLSPTSGGEDISYRGSRLFYQGNPPVPVDNKANLIYNPQLVTLKSKIAKLPPTISKESETNEIADSVFTDKIPNFLLEGDRKIVCDKGDFMKELCLLRDDNKATAKDFRKNFGADFRNLANEVEEGTGVLPFEDSMDLTTASMDTVALQPPNSKLERNVMELHNFIKSLNVDLPSNLDVLGTKGVRGKRENRRENKKLSLEEKLNRFATSKSWLMGRRKRLLEISHKKYRNFEDQRPPAETSNYALGSIDPPPRYFFSHDRAIIDPLPSLVPMRNLSCQYKQSFCEFPSQDFTNAKVQNCGTFKDKNDEVGPSFYVLTKTEDNIPRRDDYFDEKVGFKKGNVGIGTGRLEKGDRKLKMETEEEENEEGEFKERELFGGALNKDQTSEFHGKAFKQLEKLKLNHLFSARNKDKEKNEFSRGKMAETGQQYISESSKGKNEFDEKENKVTESSVQATDDSLWEPNTERVNQKQQKNEGMEIKGSMMSDLAKKQEKPSASLAQSPETVGNVDFNIKIIRNKGPEIYQKKYYSVFPEFEEVPVGYERNLYPAVGEAQSYPQNYKKNYQQDFQKNPSVPYTSQQNFQRNPSVPYTSQQNFQKNPSVPYTSQQNFQKNPSVPYTSQQKLLSARQRKFPEAYRMKNGNLMQNRGKYQKEMRKNSPDLKTDSAYRHKKPVHGYFSPVDDNPNENSFPVKWSDTQRDSSPRRKRHSEAASEKVENPDPDSESVRNKRSAAYAFQPAKGFFESEFDSPREEGPFIHELETCEKRRSCPRVKPENFSDTLPHPTIAKRKTKLSDKERLIKSYLNAPDYILEEVENAVKGKREASSSYSKKHKAIPEATSFECADPTDTMHCMRFGDLWYSLYTIKKPMISQVVGIQIYDKHNVGEGTEWREITKGKMIRIGTFLAKAEDELPSISVTYSGERTGSYKNTIDPDNYFLLIPSHVSEISKSNLYPQLDGGPAEYMLVPTSEVSFGGECNRVGTSFEAFARQPDRCAQRQGSCLKRQPVDLWREDMEARIRGKRGRYFVENFGTVPNSPIKSYTNLTGEYLALEYYGEYTSTIEIEVKADSNAIIRRGSIAQIPLAYIDSTSPKKTRIILSILNAGLTSSNFRPRLGNCPPDLDVAWCPLEGPLITIPPNQRHDFKLDLSGALPSKEIALRVEVLSQVNKEVASRKIIIKREHRCLCAFHCKCNCVGSSKDGRTCHKLSLEDYRKAGYAGQYPFRGGAAAYSGSGSVWRYIHTVLVTTVISLFILGLLKGILGLFIRRLGIAGVRVITGPRRLSTYYESELKGCSVLCDELGFPIHPTTCRPVQIVPLCIEMILNFMFFFLYPLRGIWFWCTSFSCCVSLNSDCDSCCRREEVENDRKSSRPLLSKDPDPTYVHYNLTAINPKKSRQEYLPYPAYRGDDDPLEEDDTEFVLQEMKRYRKK